MTEMKHNPTVKFVVLTAILLAVYAQDCIAASLPEDAVRTLCEYMVRTYPQATLQDLYKTCYQDFFGPGHMVTDSVSALKYIHGEMEEIKANGEDANGERIIDEPTGFRHRFVRIDLRRIVRGEMSEVEVLRRFMEAANTATPVHDNWAAEWLQIELIALQVHPQWADAALQTALHDAAKANRAVHQSQAYRTAYHPHYRIVTVEESLPATEEQ